MAEIIFENQTEQKIKIKKPGMYKVILYNDDYTSMDFVVEILVTVFYKSHADAERIMLDVHNKGRGIVGIYTYDIAITKMAIVDAIAREREFPLKINIEEA